MSHAFHIEKDLEEESVLVQKMVASPDIRLLEGLNTR